MAGDCCPDRLKNVAVKPHISITESNPSTTRNILALNLSFENQTRNCVMIFMFFHLCLEMQKNAMIFYKSILLLIFETYKGKDFL